MDYRVKFQQGLSYRQFLERYGGDRHTPRWQTVYEKVVLTPRQRELLVSFRRDLPVLCLAGAWCGDCVAQCPIFERFAEASEKIRLRFLDRDEHMDLQRQLQINAGNRVPVVVFLSEDFFEVARYGERTLAKYRQMATEVLGAACPTGVVAPGEKLLAEVTQEWLDEFERAQLLLMLSPRLREKHKE